MRLPTLFAAFILTASPVLADLIGVGANVPDASARDQNGKDVVLKEVFSRGVTLVYFYPKSDTPGCTKQACSMRDDWKTLQEKGIQVLGVSGDPVSAQKAFEEKYQLPFTIVSDVDGKVAAAFGVPMNNGKAQRSSFLVRDGKVVWTMVKASTQDHSKDVIKAFESLAK
ncbi:MAG: hypothetical protein RIS92_7 [Verrucomicrobiota bacterium]|jgi:peroxiredoxin Q/BCP